jgi:sarcosine oxidase subunit gamma
MDSNFLRKSALAQLGLASHTADDDAAAGIVMSEHPFRAIVNLRGKPDDAAFMAAAEKAIGTALPTAPNTSAEGKDTTVIWLSPEEWWVIFESDESTAERALADGLRVSLGGCLFAVVEVGESRTAIRVSGPRVRDLLAKGCPLDFHPAVFGGPGHSAQSLMAKAPAVIHQLADSADGHAVFEIYVLRSFAEYLWLWLADAAAEYGLAVKAA